MRANSMPSPVHRRLRRCADRTIARRGLAALATATGVCGWCLVTVDHPGGDIDRKCHPRPTDGSAFETDDNNDVRRGMVDLNTLKRKISLIFVQHKAKFLTCCLCPISRLRDFSLIHRTSIASTRRWTVRRIGAWSPRSPQEIRISAATLPGAPPDPRVQTVRHCRKTLFIGAIIRRSIGDQGLT